MKKLLILITAVCLLTQPILTEAKTLSYEVTATRRNQDTELLLSEWSIIWTGKCFLGRVTSRITLDKYYSSTDKENWTEITKEQYDRARNAKWWGDRYLHCNDRWGGTFVYNRRDDPYYNQGYVSVLDENFNLIAEYRSDYYIIDFAYRDGLYYIKDLYSVIYVSDDLENWTVYDEDGKIPLYSTTENMLERKRKEFGNTNDGASYTRVETNGQKSDIKYEMSRTAYFQSERDFYYYGIDNMLMVSRDGVYWAELELPDGVHISNPSAYDLVKPLYILEDSFFIRTNDYLYKFPLSELYEAIDINPPYVKLNNEILGFDVPPVLEDDRTLVPMRFLFEKMGETVTWESYTQTATVNAQDGDTISFSIDDNTAKVNNQTKTMDVPARLINEKTLVPLRFLSENLGYNVEWDDETNTAIITK
jgi:hypothetical protein